MLDIKNLHAAIDGDKEILKGFDLTVKAGKRCMPLWGRTAPEKARCLMFSRGAQGYEALRRAPSRFKGQNLLDMKPEQRAARGRFSWRSNIRSKFPASPI